MSDKAASDKLAFPMKTEISYKLDGRLLAHGAEEEEDHHDSGHTYIVAFSLDKIEFKPVKLKFLKGLAIAIVVAAYELEEEEEKDAGGHADATQNGELDEKKFVPTHHLNTFSADISANSGLATSLNAGGVANTSANANTSTSSLVADGIAAVLSSPEQEEHGELEVPAELTFDDNMEQSAHLIETTATPAVGLRTMDISQHEEDKVDAKNAAVSTTTGTAPSVTNTSPSNEKTKKKSKKDKKNKAIKKKKPLLPDDSDEDSEDESSSSSSESSSEESDSGSDESETDEKSVSQRRALTHISPSSPGGSNHACVVPTWAPASYFSYPIGDIPVKYTLPSDLTLESFNDVKHIADGSNSNVYLGKYNHQRVIIKMIKEEAEHDPIAIQEFDLEYGTLARLNHPNIIGVVGAGFEPRRFIVLEHLGGGSLNTMLNKNQEQKDIGKDTTSGPSFTNKLFRKPSFTYANLLQNARLMAEGLDYLHRTCHPGACFIHRDLKPDNVGFTKGGQLKLFDFGLVTCVKARSTVNQAYEMTGYTGSLRYMAPEVVMRKPYTEKADVYSFGIMLWQMARDKVPFKGFTKDEFIEHVVEYRERPKCDKSWPIGFTRLINACWDHDQHKRPSFQVIVQEINKLIAAEVGDSLLGPAKPKKVGIFG